MAIVRLESNPHEGSEFNRSRQEINRLFNLFSPGADPFFSRVYPAINLTEEGDNFYVRAGIGDVPVNGSMFRKEEHYSRQFGMRLTAGFSYDLSKRVRKGLWINYATATDKVWAGLDQQLDVTLSF